MKFSKLSQLFLVSIIGLLVATLLTSCAIVTIDYVFVGNSAGSGAGSAGQIQTFDADSETGALRSGARTVPSGGINPVSMATSSDYANLYVVNEGSNNVVHFSISGFQHFVAVGPEHRADYLAHALFILHHEYGLRAFG